MSSPGSAVLIEDLHKSYGEVAAVRGVGLRIEAGEVFALLGPNGAGKTTTVEILEGFRERDSGRVEVLGLDPVAAGRDLRRRVGMVLQDIAIEPYLTVGEVVGRNARFYPHSLPVDEVLERVGLHDAKRSRIRTLSGGQQRRLDLALAIVGRPELLFLDEPTTGFDPSARRDAWELIRSLRDLGTTVLLTTHYMEEAQALADRLAVIAGGLIVAMGTPESLGGRDQAAVRIRFDAAPDLDLDRLPVNAQPDGPGRALVRTDDPTRTLHLLTGWMIQRGQRLSALTVDRPTLEDIYLELVNAAQADP